MNRTMRNFAVWGATALLPLWGAIVAGQEAPSDKAAARNPVGANPTATENPYYLGVHPVPIDEVLKGQLNLPGGLVVDQIVPDSPAAQAGIKRGDILLRFGDRSLNSVQELLEAVTANGKSETSLTILRGGQEETLKVTPAERPEELRIELAAPRDGSRVAELLADQLKLEGVPGMGEHGFRFRVLQPGIVVGRGMIAEERPFPDELSVQIHKSGKAPAEISVTFKDQSWTFREDQLEKIQELPEAIRGNVLQFVQRTPSHLHFRAFRNVPGEAGNEVQAEAHAYSFTIPERGNRREWIEQYRKQMQEALKKVPPEHADAVRKSIEKALEPFQSIPDQAAAGSAATEELRQEVRQLREAIEDLRNRLKSANR